jgi:hypothetical protein
VRTFGDLITVVRVRSKNSLRGVITLKRFSRIIAVLALGFAGTAIGLPAASAGSEVIGGAVYAVKPLPGGGKQVTNYRPAPGVTADELAKSLRAKGVAGVTVDNGGAFGPAASCSFGTATSWDCPMPLWPHNGFARPQVYFLDHSTAAWPVSQVVPVWNQASGIDSIYRHFSLGCPGGGVHCVHVFSLNYGDTGWTGLTSRTVNASNQITSAEVRLNDFYGGTAAEHRNTACHETGHVLSIDDNFTDTTTCMFFARTSTTMPSGDDFGLLNDNY